MYFTFDFSFSPRTYWLGIKRSAPTTSLSVPDSSQLSFEDLVLPLEPSVLDLPDDTLVTEPAVRMEKSMDLREALRVDFKLLKVETEREEDRWDPCSSSRSRAEPALLPNRFCLDLLVSEMLCLACEESYLSA